MSRIHYTAAQTIASQARYWTAGTPAPGATHCVGDAIDAELVVSQQEWEHLPRRAKTYGAKFEQGRGLRYSAKTGTYHGAWGEVVAPDGSRCCVLLGTAHGVAAAEKSSSDTLQRLAIQSKERATA